MAKTNRQYWIDRAEHRETVSSEHAKQAEQVLAYNYRKAAAQMRKEINDFYNRYAGENGLTYAEAVREMNRTELREWRGSVEDYIKQIQNEPNPEVRERLMREYDARYYNSRISRLDGLCGNANMILGDLYRRSEAEFRRLLGDEYVDGFYKALYDIQTRLGYNGNFSTIDAQMVQNALNYPWSGANFSDRLWKNKEALMSSMREVITQGLIRGDSMPGMTRALAERLDASLSNAGRLIRTETSHIHNTAEIAAYEAAGYEEYEFMASFGERTCEVCGGLDGQHFKIADIQYGVNFPPVHPNCRCTTVGWDEADEEPLQLEGQQQLDYEEWKKLYVDDRVEVEIPIQPEPPVPVVPAVHNADNQRLTTGGDSGIIDKNDIFIHPDKINKFCLYPKGKHADEFFDVGYKPGDYEALYQDLVRGFDESKIVDIINSGDGVERFSVFMELGVGKKKRFRTVWQKDSPDSKPRFITAHRED